MRIMCAVTATALALVASPAVADDEALTRAVFKVKAAIDFGVSAAEVSDLAKAVYVEVGVTMNGGETAPAALEVVDVLRDTARAAGECTYQAWSFGSSPCAPIGAALATKYGLSATPYQDPRVPWKSPIAVMAPIISAKADAALAEIKKRKAR